MKKIICIVFLISVVAVLKAQDIDPATKAYIYANQFKQGKEGVDKFLAKNANSAEGWYYKAYVYNALARDNAKTIDEGNASNRESFEAIKKYRVLDPKEKLTKEESNGTIYNIYYSFYDFAIKAYNAKNYDVSFKNFKDALDAHDYIYVNKLLGPKGLSFSALDTDVVWNLAVLGDELKDSVSVNGYYKSLIDADLKGDKYLVAYEQLVLRYQRAKEQALFEQYLQKGKSNFPDDPFFEQIDIQNAIGGLSGPALFKKYDELASKYPNSYVVWLQYGDDLNKYVYADENKNLNVSAYKTKVPETLKKAIAIKSTPEANMLLANFYYNNSFDLSDASSKIKGTKPDDVKKRTDLLNASKKSLDDCLPWAMAAVDLYSKQPKLKGTEKTNYRLAYDMLAEIYRVKGDPKKSAEFKAKKDAIQ